MPSYSQGKYFPNSTTRQNDCNPPVPNKDGAPDLGEEAESPKNAKYSAPQKFALLPEETEQLQDGNSIAGHVEYERPGCCQKYSNALKVLIPFRPARKNKQKLPSNKAGLISFFSVTWLTKLMWKAFRKGLDQSDLWELQDEDCSAVSCARVQRLWSEERAEAKKNGSKPDLTRVVWRAAKTRVLVTMFISIFYNIFQFMGPSIFLKLTLDYINDPAVNHYYGGLIVALICLNNIVRGACFNMMFVLGSHTATRLCGGMQSLIYQKVLKMKTGGEKISAQITNILTNDMERLFEAVISSVFITASPMLLLLSASYSVYLIGPWALLGIGCYLMFYPVMGGIAKAQSKLRVKTVKKTDKRVGLMTEILNNLKLIKMYAWEDSFSSKIAGIRREELKRHRYGALLQAISSTMVPSISILATISTLLGYTLTGRTLTASEAFTIHSVFTAMQFTVGVLPFTVRSVAEAKISVARIQKLLELPEHMKKVSGLMNNNLALVIKNATFAFETHSIDLKTRNAAGLSKNKNAPTPRGGKSDQKTEPAMNGPALNNEPNEKTDLMPYADSEDTSTSPTNSPNKSANVSPHRATVRRILSVDGSVEMCETLFGVNLSVERGKLIGVCGSVGAGKSSLVSAIVGDMKLSSGFLHVNGRVALVTQQAWIYNATLRENILVGAPFDEERYKNVIDVCALQTDLDQFSNGDLSEIGDRGINLSGGQKQRVNLARALYSNRDIYLLDDPLSAVDTKVAKHLFNKCIKGALKDMTVLLICHGIHFLEQCDEVILMKGGRICERGTHQALMDRRGQYFEMAGYSFGAEAPTADAVEMQKRKRRESEMENNNLGDLKSEGKLVQEEKKEKGSVSGKVYLTFIKVCGGWCICFLVLSVICAFNLIRIFNTIWLQIWLDHGDGLENMRVQNESLYNITYSNDEIKGDITQNPNLWIFQLVYGLSFVALIAVGILKGIGIAFRVLAGASRLHRDMFNSILRAPISFLDMTPSGRILNRFSRDMDEVDVRVPFFLEFVSQGTLSVLAQIVMVCVFFPLFVLPLVVIAGLFFFVDFFLNSGIRELKRLDNTLKSPVLQHLASSVSGLSIIRSFDRETIFVDRFNNVLDKHSVALLLFRLSNRWFTYRMDLMSTIVILAITSICVFTKGQFSTAIAGLALSTVIGVCGFIPFLMRMKSEFQSRLTSAERIMEYAYELDSEAPRKIEETEPCETWPKAGCIEIRDVRVRYRPQLPLVLNGISANIKAAEKIGIVGRTGAGKSSLISTLLRLVECESGSILIDGVDISTIGLHSLRSAISVIPQDPVLFQGSIRYNLDPFDEHSDEALWTALEQSHLKGTVTKLPRKLQSEVEAAGENFSVGERQLICLARALLRNSKILLLDEATASVDLETDHLIQSTIRDAFVSCTVITIAHRLNTIASYDRILVLHKGTVREFDTPAALMQTQGSLFHDMMVAMGVQTVEQMESLL